APNVFFSTAPQRIGLARQRFFDEGTRPTGLVPDAVIQSWTRCLQSHRDTGESISFTPVTRSRIEHTVARNRLLLEAGLDELQKLQTVLAGTACKAILTDARCMVVHATQTERKDGELMWLAGRVGVDLSEECVGTTAPGMVAISGRECTVHGGEHYFRLNQALHCAAAPIRDVRGELVAVLDLTSESRAFQFDAAALVHLFATSIENRLLRRQSKPHVLLHFQAAAALLHTPLEGLAAIDEDGRIAWMNGVARSLLQAPSDTQLGRTVEESFGLKLSQLAAAARAGKLLTHQLPNGLKLCVQAKLQAQAHGSRHLPAPPTQTTEPPLPRALPSLPEATARPAPLAVAQTPPDARLRDADLHLIERTLAACLGNVSRAARQLGVSRGLVYRRIKQRAAGG
ncbi:MAG: helix-turn-helix domain-containing protein, partial [Rubrivivax sp.]